MEDEGRLVSDPVSLVGVDPLQTRSIIQSLTRVAFDHHVVIEQLSELDDHAQVQVKIHASTDVQLQAAIEALATPGSSSLNSNAKGVGDSDDDAGTATVVGSDAKVSTTHGAARENLEQDAGDTSMGTPPAGERRHASWECAGCSDCVPEPPPPAVVGT